MFQNTEQLSLFGESVMASPSSPKKKETMNLVYKRKENIDKKTKKAIFQAVSKKFEDYRENQLALKNRLFQKAKFNLSDESRSLIQDIIYFESHIDCFEYALRSLTDEEQSLVELTFEEKDTKLADTAIMDKVHSRSNSFYEKRDRAVIKFAKLLGVQVLGQV